MNKKKWIFGISIALLLFAAHYLYDQKLLEEQRTKLLKAQGSIEGTTLSDSTAISKDLEAKALAEKRLAEDAAKSQFKISTPSLEEIRKDVDKDPHGTPEKLTQFSHHLGEKLRSAQTPAQKISLFIELESCALGDNAESVQALCLLNARKLAQSEKKLESGYQTLSQKVSPAALKRIEMIP